METNMDIYAELVNLCGRYFAFSAKLFVDRVVFAGLGKTEDSFGLSDLAGFIGKIEEFAGKSLTGLQIDQFKGDLSNLQKKLAERGASFTAVSSIQPQDKSKLAQTDILSSFLSQSQGAMSMMDQILKESALFVLTNPAGEITYVNERFIELTKYSREEAIGQNNRILASGFHTPGFFDNLWLTLSEGNVFRADIRNKAKDGSIFWVRAVFMPLFDAANKITGYCGVWIPVTDLMSPVEELYLRQQKGETLSTQDLSKLFSYQNGSTDN